MNTLIAAAIRCSLMFPAVAAVSLVHPAQAYIVTMEQMGVQRCGDGKRSH